MSARSDRAAPVLGVGIVGAGNVARTRHLPILRDLGGVRTVALADTDPVRREQAARSFAVARSYSDHRSLLEDRAVDIVAVCAPVGQHFEIASAALAAGKHLYLEKPVAASLAEADRLVERAGRGDRKVQVGFHLRWQPRIVEAREILRRGGLGEIELVRATFTSHKSFAEDVPEWEKRRHLGGGTIVEVAIHLYDLFRHLLACDVDEVYALSRSGDWDDASSLTSARAGNGALLTALSSTATTRRNDLDIFGRDGALHVDCLRFDGIELLPRDALPGDPAHRLRQLARTLGGAVPAIRNLRRGGDHLAAYRGAWLDLLRAIRDDSPVGCSLEDGREALRIALAAAISAREGRPIAVKRVAGGVADLGHPGPGSSRNGLSGV